MSVTSIRQPADTSATVIALPQPPAATPVPINLNALTERALEVIFFASGMRYNPRQRPSYAELAAVVVDQINRVGLEVITEIARQLDEACNNYEWHTIEALMPGREARDDARWLAHTFRLGRAQAAGSPSGAAAVWQHARTPQASNSPAAA